MASETVSIRLLHLLCPDLTAPIKLVSLALQMDKNVGRRKLRSPSYIQKRVGVCRPTVRKAFACLEEVHRPQMSPDLQALPNLHIDVPRDLIRDKALPAMARVLYCIILGLQEMKKRKILKSYARIAQLLRVQSRTVRRAVLQLVDAGWLGVEQKNQLSPIEFTFPDRKEARRNAQVRRAEQRLEKAKYVGEALALLWCDTLVEGVRHIDDHFPDSFVNPHTNELLQADRYYFYQKGVAIEFNGAHHYGPTERFSEQQVKAQMERDRIKQQICNRQGIALITLRPEDLTYHRMREQLGEVLPISDIPPDEPIVRFLERASSSYRASTRRLVQRSRTRRRRRRGTKSHNGSVGPQGAIAPFIQQPPGNAFGRPF